MKKYYHIYKIINNINNKIYIGRHFGTIEDNYDGSGLLLHKAYKKYGKENFTKSLIEINTTLEENKQREIFWIKELNTFQPIGYNINIGGDGGDNLTNNPNYDKIVNNISNGIKKRNLEHPEIMKNAHNKIKGNKNGRWKGGISSQFKIQSQIKKEQKYKQDQELKNKLLTLWFNNLLSVGDICNILHIGHSKLFRFIKELQLPQKERKRKTDNQKLVQSIRISGKNNPRYYELDNNIYQMAKKDYYDNFYYLYEIHNKYNISIDKFKAKLQEEGLKCRPLNHRRPK